MFSMQGKSSIPSNDHHASGHNQQSSGSRSMTYQQLPPAGSVALRQPPLSGSLGASYQQQLASPPQLRRDQSSATSRRCENSLQAVMQVAKEMQEQQRAVERNIAALAAKRIQLQVRAKDAQHDACNALISSNKVLPYEKENKF